MSTQDTLTDILRRLADLEAADNQGEALSPTYIQIGPGGSTSVAFPGGVIDPEQSGAGFTLGNGFAFTPIHGSGINGIIASLFAIYLGGGAHSLQIGSYSDSNDQAFITYNTTEVGGVATAVINAQAQDHSGASTGITIIRSDGVSSFLQGTKNLSDIGSAATARTNLGLGSAAVEPITFFLQAANNLSDVANVATARTNLGLGSAALQASTFFLQVANNLSDVANVATARTNLGLGSAALQASTFFAQVANNLSDLANVATARANLGFGTANPLRMSSVGGISLSWSASVTGSVVVNHGLKDASGANLTPQACYPSLAFGTPAVVTGITYDPASMTSTQVTVYGVRPTSTTITLPITVLSVA